MKRTRAVAEWANRMSFGDLPPETTAYSLDEQPDVLELMDILTFARVGHHSR